MLNCLDLHSHHHNEKISNIFSNESQENEEMKEKLRSTVDELSKLKSESQKELETAQKRAESEKVAMMAEIVSLQEELEKTNGMIVKAKEEISSISNDSALQAEQKLIEITAKDEQIKDLVSLRNEYENKINELQVECQKLKVALDESEKINLEVQKKFNDLQKNSESTQRADRETIAKSKTELAEERKKSGSLKELLNIVKTESEKELEKIRLETSEERQRMEMQVSKLQAELADATDRIERARKSVFEVRQAADAKVARMEKETKKFKESMRNLSSQEKTELKRRLWDLEYKLNKAKYDVIVAEKEARTLREAAMTHEKQIQDLEESHQIDIYELEQNVIAKEMFFAKARKANKEKSQRLVIKFRNKLQRKETKAVSSLEDLRQQLLKAFGLEIDNRKGKNLSFDDQATELAAVISKVLLKMKATNDDFEAKVIALEKSLNHVREQAEKDLKEKEEEYMLKLEDERQKAFEEKDRLVNEKFNDIKKVEEEGRRNISTVRLEYTEKLNKSKVELEKLKNSLEEKNKLIQNYEEEQRSYRKLAKLVWKATREKISSPIRRKKSIK